MDASAIQRAITRITYEILERNHGADQLAVIGIYSRGVILAELEHRQVELGALDITTYRDDKVVPNHAEKTKIDFSVHEGSIPQRDGELLKQLLKSEFMRRYSPICYGFITSPELSVFRKGKEGRLVNRKSIKLFNDCMESEKTTIQQGAKKYTEIVTDPYQDHLKRFIMDITESITSDVREQIMEKEKNNKRNNYKNT